MTSRLTTKSERPPSRRIVGVAAAILIAGIIGGLFGASTGADVDAAEASGAKVGTALGIERGDKAGSIAGQEDGKSAGTKLTFAKAEKKAAAKWYRVSYKQAYAKAKEAEEARILEAERQAAAAEAAERASNCNAPLFAEGYCPTDAEIAQEGDAERICGGGLTSDPRYEELCF